MKRLICASILWFAGNITISTANAEDSKMKKDNSPNKIEYAYKSENKIEYAYKSENKKALAQLDSYFDTLTQHNKFIGSVGMYRDGALYYQYIATYNNGVVSRTNSTFKYRIGSITKMFTSVMILQLIEEGKLSLDTKLAAFYPAIVNADTINIAQMLDHSSGIKNYTDELQLKGMISSFLLPSTIINMIESYESLFKPGTKNDYSNSNYFLLGHVIEQVTQLSYQQNLAVRITEKFNLLETYHGGKLDYNNNEVASYAFDDDKWELETEANLSFAHAAGAIMSTTEDLNQFIYALFEGKLINKTSLTTMIEINNGYGKGIFKESRDSYGHSGDIDAFESTLAYLPTEKTGIAILQNGSNFDRYKIMKTMVAVNRGEPIEIPNFSYITLPSAQLKLLTGLYKSPDSERDITISVQEGQLYGHVSGIKVFPLDALSENKFIHSSSTLTISFEKEKPAFVVTQSDGKKLRYTRNKTLSEVKVSKEVLARYSGTYKNKDFYLDFKVFVDDDKLKVQPTGQKVISLTPRSDYTFNADRYGIVLTFEHEKNEMTFSQSHVSIVLTK